MKKKREKVKTLEKQEKELSVDLPFKNIFDFIKDVSQEKRNIYDLNPELADKIYSKFMTDLMLSQHADCIMIVNELNCRPNIPKRRHYDFLLHRLPMRKRFAKTAKPSVGVRVQLIMDAYNYSTQKALEVLDLFDDAGFDAMRESLRIGGMSK